MTRRLFTPLLAVTAAMFAVAPVLIARAPYESTMGLVQKIFYFHVPAGIVMFTGAFVCGISSALFLARGRPGDDRRALAAGELTVVFGVIALTTGPLWARKAWGVWWQWDARLTSTLVLVLIFLAYLLVRRYGGPGAERLGAVLAVFGMVNVPFVYWSVNVWRTMHPRTTVVPTLDPSMRPAFWWAMAAFFLLFAGLMTLRMRLEEQRAALDRLWLAREEREVHS